MSIRKKSRIIAAIVLIVCLTLMLGCAGQGGGGQSSPPSSSQSSAPSSPTIPTGRDYILIGIPNPTTGPLASFGYGTPWAENLVVDYINNKGGIYMEEYGVSMPVRIVTVDTASDFAQAGEVTRGLVLNEKVDLLLARHTPGTAIPVTVMGNSMRVPVISMESPTNAWLEGGPYDWAFHSFWSAEMVCETFAQAWLNAGLEGATVGLLFPNEPDGITWGDVFNQRLPELGFKISDAGRWPPDQADFSTVINQFASDGVDIVTGSVSPPDFGTYIVQSKQLGFWPKLHTVGRAYLFPASVQEYGDEIGDGLTSEVWWSPDFPYKCAVTGITPRELCDLYEKEFNERWSSVIGYKHAIVAQAIDVLQRAGSLDPAKIRDAIAATDLDTLVGHIKYNEQGVSYQPVTFGQWQKDPATGEIMLIITDSPLYPEIPAPGTTRLNP